MVVGRWWWFCVCVVGGFVGWGDKLLLLAVHIGFGDVAVLWLRLTLERDVHIVDEIAGRNFVRV